MTIDEKPKNESSQERYDRYLIKEQKLQVQRDVHWEIIESILSYTERKSKSDTVTMALSEIVYKLFEAYYSICKELIALKLSNARMNSRDRGRDESYPD